MNIFKFIKIALPIVLIIGCEEDVASSVAQEASNINTLNQSSLGFEASFESYYFDLSSNFSAKYLYYQSESPTLSTLDFPSLMDPERDTLGLKSFPDFILKVDSDTIGASFTQLNPFDETLDNCTVVSDSCPDIDGDGLLSSDFTYSGIEQIDSVQIFSGGPLTSYKKLEWDTEDGRYKPFYESDTVDGVLTINLIKDTVVYIDSDLYKYDSTVYVTFIDDFITDLDGQCSDPVITNTDSCASAGQSWNYEQFYFDQAEYIKRDSVYTGPSIPLQATFEFKDLVIQSSQDTVMNRVNTDCNLDGVASIAENFIADYNSDGDSQDIVYEFNDINGNGILDSGENTIYNWNQFNDDGTCSFVFGCDDDFSDIHYEFEDLSNGAFDQAEVYWDKDGDGEYDLSEPFEDLNCNGLWDDAESVFSEFTSQVDCEDSDLLLSWDGDESLCFLDKGNGQWDDAEYVDANGSLTRYFDSASNLLVDYSDPSAPVAVPIIDLTTSVRLRNSADGVYYTPFISVDSVRVVTDNSITQVDSIQTIFSNQIIMQSYDDDINNKNFSILKSEYPSSLSKNNYHYSILNNDSHLQSLRFASYFKPYGFYDSPAELRNGFWFEESLSMETLYYLYDGKIREGEHVFFDTVYVTVHGDYEIEADYLVEWSDSLVVPMRKQLFDSTLGSCFADPSVLATTNELCLEELGASALDSTLYDLFKVIKTSTMTMLGSGVEYGERVTSYLAQDIGLVKEVVEYRWSERVGQSSPQWSVLSKIEMSEFRPDNSLDRFGGVLGNIFQSKKVRIDELDQIDGDPFVNKRTVGIQPVQIPSN